MGEPLNNFIDVHNIVNNTITDTITSSNIRHSPLNPYDNTNITFSNNPTKNYVTNSGTYKPYLDDSVWENNSGKNGCPNITYTNIPKNEYSSVLKQGTPMVKGQSCGNEGQNVYVSNLVENPRSTYDSCYVKNGLTSVDNVDTFAKCQEYALDNGSSYFGTQTTTDNGRVDSIKCFVSSDISSLSKSGPIYKSLQIWQSNTGGKDSTIMYVNPMGNIRLSNSSDIELWSSNSPQDNCVWNGNINQDTITGSYGANCIGQNNRKTNRYRRNQPAGTNCKSPDTSLIGNLTNILKNTADKNADKTVFSYSPLTDWSTTDEVPCCDKRKIDYSYQCGGGPFKSGSIVSGKNINFDCTTQVNNCKIYVIIQDDANVVIYRGVDPTKTNSSVVWNSGTHGKYKDPNPNWVETKGKFGRNYMKMGETLSPGEWIGSTNGYAQLLMTLDGNLVINTCDILQPCDNKNGILTGGVFDDANNTDTVAFYKLNNVGNKDSLGKIGYISSDSKLREYSSDMLQYSNEYTIFNGYNSNGNDIKQTSGANIDDCQTECNNTVGCAGFVWQPNTGNNTGTCYLKNENTYPKSKRVITDTMRLGVRNKTVKPDKTCSNKIVNIDSVQYDNYIKDEPLLNGSTCPYEEIVTTAQKDTINNTEVQFSNWTKGNLNNTNNVQIQQKSVFDTIKNNSNQFDNSYKSYENTNIILQNGKINTEPFISSNNIIEKMTNHLNSNDLKRMQEDSSLIVVSEHYEYIIWTVLALSALSLTIKTIYK